MKKAKIYAILWREGKHYVSKCPEHGVASCGDTKVQALENLKEAMDLYLENAKALGMLSESRQPRRKESP